MAIELLQYNYLPPGFLDSTARTLYQFVPGPALIHLPGKNTSPIFVSILLHGNEPVGLRAIQLLLQNYRESGLPRSLSFFIGNVAAAKNGVRRLDHQPDFNRVWPHPELTLDLPETRLMQQVYDEMALRQPFLSIDLHNNTGLNPHYACINKLENQFYHLANLFGKTVVFFTLPIGVQSMAFANLCPAVTLECGHVDDTSGVEHAFEFLDACMQLVDLPATPPNSLDIDLFHTVANVKIPKEFSFSFDDSTQDLYFSNEIEKLNFVEVEKGSLFALTHPDKKVGLEVINEHGEDVASKYFSFNNNEIRLQKSVMPSMLTLNKKVIEQDCFCYLMERIEI